MQLGGAEQGGQGDGAVVDGPDDRFAPTPAPGSAVEAIAVARTMPGGLLIQTTHWHQQGRRQSLVVAAVVVFLFLSGDGAPRIDSAILALVSGSIVLVLGRIRWRRGGLLITPEGTFSRAALGRPIPIDTAQLLEQKPARITTMPSGPSDYLGFLLPPHRWQFIPGLRARAAVAPFGGGLLAALTGALVGAEASKLTSRPLQPWYRFPARPTVHDDVLWDTSDGGRALQVALGIGPRRELPEPDDGTADASAGQADATALVHRRATATRLERWNRDAA